MKKIQLFIILIVLSASTAIGQVGINIDGSQPDNSAMLDVKSTTKGALLPRMTTEQMNSIITPPDGLLVYNITVKALYWFNGSTWKQFNETGYTETDPIFISSPANGISTTSINNWNTAYEWGNHATAGYLKTFTESDPIFVWSASFLIMLNDISNWNSSYSWGNHALAGYLTSFTEVDPMFESSVAYGITASNTTNWTTAYSWGNHASAGYLTSFTETDPIFQVHPSSGISAINIINWNTAFGWGNHANSGYLTSFTETDPIYVASVAAGITTGNISNWSSAFSWGNHAAAGYLTSFTEVDPIFQGHPAAGISSADLCNWNDAYYWGNHATMGYLTGFSETDPIFAIHPASGINALNIINWNNAFSWGNHALAGYLTSFTETDPIFVIHPSSGITSNFISNWNAAYSWGNHALAGYLTSYTEVDPIFASHVASGITFGNISNWNTAYNWGNHAGLYTPLEHKTAEDALNGLVKVNGSGIYSAIADNSPYWNTAYNWGNHALAGYLTTESDPIFLTSPAHGITSGNIITWNNLVSFPGFGGSHTTAAYGDHTHSGYLTTESDPVFLASPAYGITLPNISNWNSSYGWGNHASAGYLTSFTETDPFFNISVASGITLSNTTNWNAAYGWGNHANAGYLTGFTETDPIYGASVAAGITSANTTHWNTAYSWGNHATVGYLTSFTEIDPIFSSSVAAGITTSNTLNWNTAYGWGNHSTAGYLTSFSEVDPLFGASVAAGISTTNTVNWNTAYGWGNHATVGYLTSYTETDPVFGSSVAQSITLSNTTNWNTAYGWGDHSGLYEPLIAKSLGYAKWTGTNWSFTNETYSLSNHNHSGVYDPAGTGADLINTHNSTFNHGNIAHGETAFGWGNHATVGYLTSYTEIDPMFSSSIAAGITGINTANWNTAFSWGNHSVAGYLKNFTEVDPVFGVHPASGISALNIINWNTAFGWGNHASAGYLTSFTEIDPIYVTSAAYSITFGKITDWNTAYSWGNHASAGYLTSFTETDPIFQVHPAHGILSTDITNWNVAFGWGNHSGLYRPIGYVPSWGEITSNPFLFTSSANNQLIKYNSTSGKWENWMPNYLTGFTETDPVFVAWDKSTGINIVASQVSDFQTSVTNNPAMLANTAKNSYPIADAAKLAGIEASAEVNVNADWNAASGDAQIINKPALATVATSGNYNDLINRPTIVNSQWTSTGSDITYSQGKVGIGTTNPDPSAELDVSSTNKGFLPPRLTIVQRNAIPSPAEGLTIYNMDLKCIEFYTGSTTGWYCPCLSFGTISCTTPVINGSYYAGTALDLLNTVTLNVNVAIVGAYNITTSLNNGYMFSALGTFLSTGSQTVTLNGNGTPLLPGTNTFTVYYGTSSCTFSILILNQLTQNHCGSTYTYREVINPATGAIWLDRNLEANQVATSSNDYLAYGGLYQWGRLADGHQCISWSSSTSGTPVNGATSTTSPTDIPGTPLFITSVTAPIDWRIPQNDNLWQGGGGINNPCPSGYRVPTVAEMDAERASWTTQDAAGAYNSPLKLVLAGHRHPYVGGAPGYSGEEGVYWSSSVYSVNSWHLSFGGGFAVVQGNSARAHGLSVRCIKD